jgi:hypothetical protein
VLEILPGLLDAVRAARLTAVPLPTAFMPPADAQPGRSDVAASVDAKK